MENILQEVEIKVENEDKNMKTELKELNCGLLIKEEVNFLCVINEDDQMDIVKEEAEEEPDQEDNIDNNESEPLYENNCMPLSSHILKGLLTNYQEKAFSDHDKEISEEDFSLAEAGHSLEVGDLVEPIKTAPKFKVNLSAIESVSKQNQASELQNLDGLSVYDQATLEAGILRQVDQALDRELEAPGRLDAAVLLEPEEEETDMERQIRLGEMTPFGTTLSMSSTPALKQTDGLLEIEKYFHQQAELHGKRKRKTAKSKQEAISKQHDIELINMKENERKQDLRKKKIAGRFGKKKIRKKENLGTETEDFVPWTEKPGLVAGETAYTRRDDASGSEYVPSDSDYLPSSGEDVQVKHKEKKEKPPTQRKRKVKPYKIPEDWNSDDSDWEYSDEEGNYRTSKRSKKELDDGDVDGYNRRIRQWQRERQREGADEQTQQYHEFDGDYKLPLDMWDKLYNYQRVGVRWLWELSKQHCGGVLGDEMGLGKTVQVIAFMAGLHVSDLKDRETSHRGLGPTLIVCPTTVMHQWVREFHVWYPPIRVAILHESGTFCGKQRSRLIGNIVQAGGILITSYTGATQHKEEIVTRRWHYVVLDEGHKIRNPDAQITLIVKQLRTPHRIILSGSPMQNNLKELWSLFDFVFPGKLGTLPVFLEQFAVPITQGGYANASQVQVMTAFKCATVLKDTIAPYLLRRMKADVKSHIKLPEKNEQVLFCRLTEEQRQYYKGYVESGEVGRILEGRLKIFMGLINLRKICNHPDLYSGGPKLFPGDKEEDLPKEEQYGHWEKSGKMIVVETLLKLWKKQGHRVLLFTQSRQMLAIMEAFVKEVGYSYLKLDGSTSIAARQPLINKFNQDPSYFVMLLTTRVGGLGVNLTGANRVLIYDPDWNPATDTQARERAWRIGQKQNVTVYRLITAGTIEEKMYHRQIFKQFLCNKVLKDPRQRRFFKSNDLYELFTLKETDVEGSTETAAIFAGTNSEVKLDPTKTYKHRTVKPRLMAEPPAETFSRKKAENKKKMEEKAKKKLLERSEQNSSPGQSDLSFSDKKIEQMKKLAQMLSQKCVRNASPNNSHPTSKAPQETVAETEHRNEDVVLISDGEGSSTAKPGLYESTPSTSRVGETPGEGTAHEIRKHKKKHKHKKRNKHKDAKFEGEVVPHLVKSGTASLTTEETDDGKNYASQDDYVLQRLFAKSGLQTAMKHDTIMEGGPADYALVEGEADRVAKQAVEKLKESRRECWRPASGVPTFTGVNGARNFQAKPKFGNVKTLGTMSSSELLERIRKRNIMVDAKDHDLDLLQDIRDFVSSHGGTVNTNELITRFEGRLAEGSSPLFKSLLSKICSFYRAPDKLGYWTLKQDFV